MHSREYIRRILKAASAKDPGRYKRAAARLRGKTVHVIIETAEDEQVYLIGGDDGRLNIASRSPKEKVDVFLRIPPLSIRKVLEGVETPVESFFLGHLRAKGHTRDLYTLHAFFLDLAEIAVASNEIQDIVESFQTTKEGRPDDKGEHR